MIRELIKLAEDLDKAGKPGLADKVDSLLDSLESDEDKIARQIAAKVMELGSGGARVRMGSTAIGIGNTAVLFGYQGSEGGIPGNAGDTTAKSKQATQNAIDALGLSRKVMIKEVYQDEITGMGYVGDSAPPASYERPASYQVDIVSLEFAK
jgi:hypothetical protein